MRCQLKTVSTVYNTLKWTLGLQRCCLLCGGTSPEKMPLCPGCCADLPWLHPEHCCPQCSLPDTGGARCARCCQQAFAFDHCIAALSYRWPIDRLIGEFKYRYRTAVLPALADPLLQRLQQHYTQRPWPKLLLAVPQHPKRLRERGFDQAALLARYLSRRTEIPYNGQLLLRQRHTPRQQTLDHRQRRKNIRAAFTLKEPVPQKRIALIDDVVTSGATAAEISRLLKGAGAEQIDVWTLARTPQRE